MYVYAVCVCRVSGLAGSAGRRPCCVQLAVRLVVMQSIVSGHEGRVEFNVGPGKNTAMYTRYTRLITRGGGKYKLSVALPFIINYWQHLRWRWHDEQLSKVKNTTVWLQILLCVCVCVSGVDGRTHLLLLFQPPRPCRTRPSELLYII